MNGDVRRGAIRPVLDAKGRLDQLEDRLSGTQEAGGSNPPASTIFLKISWKTSFRKIVRGFWRGRKENLGFSHE